ncbi:hypothetical protein Dvul_0494 [Nitratidesulfovibrio vulgaris DP4]|uniref:Uncharacterized protein n=1 Tax=Nitratidesulfovibrio vulgaris (strain DP4) TaxID=391774 RepID=A0A0H3A4V1_NITV4|nr:hypothetical protein Dvul_0494 [Nitratidesulfovibrio vulgaris DP4]
MHQNPPFVLSRTSHANDLSRNGGGEAASVPLAPDGSHRKSMPHAAVRGKVTVSPAFPALWSIEAGQRRMARLSFHGRIMRFVFASRL